MEHLSGSALVSSESTSESQCPTRGSEGPVGVMQPDRKSEALYEGNNLKESLNENQEQYGTLRSEESKPTIDRARIEPQTTLHEAFERLKWSLLDPPCEVQILEVHPDYAQWRSLFHNASPSTILDVPATQPAKTCLSVKFEVLHSRCQYDDWDAQMERPEPLFIENKDGRPVTVKQFIHKVYEYTLPLRKLLCERTDTHTGDMNDWTDARFYLSGVRGSAGNGLDRRDPEFHLAIEGVTSERDEALIVGLWPRIENRYRERLATELEAIHATEVRGSADQPSSQRDRIPEAQETTIHEVFGRLKWPILDPPSEIEVLDSNSQGELRWKKLLEGPYSHVLDEPATVPPKFVLYMTLRDINHSYRYDSCPEARPKELLILTEDGRPVTVQQVIYALHEYALSLSSAMGKCFDGIDSTDTRFYLRDILAELSNSLENPHPEFHITLVPVTSETKRDLEELVTLMEMVYRMSR